MIKLKWGKKVYHKTFAGISRFISNLSIFYKIYYGIIIIVSIIIIISSYISYYYLRNIYQNEAMDNAARLVNNINIGFQDNLDQVDRIIMSIYSDTRGNGSSVSMQDVISSKDYTSLSDEYAALNATKNFFQRLIFLRKDFNSIYIYVSKNKVFSYAVNGANKLGYDPIGENWFKQTISANGSTVISAPHIPYQLNYKKAVISFSRLLKSTTTTEEANAIVLIDLSVDSIDNIVDKVNLGKTTGVLFMDKDGKVIYSNNTRYEEKDLDRNIIENVVKYETGTFTADILGEKYLIAYNTSKVTNWKLLTLTPYSEVSKDDKKILIFNLLLMAMVLAITVFISYGFSKVIFKPIGKLHNGMSKVKEGNFDFQLDYSSNDELGQLVANFNSLVFTIKTLIVEKYEERIARNDAEFKYLQTQINPHFLYNTLQTISSMAVVKKVPEISQVSKGLAKMLRYSINNKNKIITLKEEVENLICYLDIQKIRFKDILNYKISFEEEVYAYGIVKLVLQPIVENSIIHGIEGKGTDSLIEVSGRKIGDRICIEISDNGIGMADEKVSSLQKEIESPSENEAAAAQENGHNSVGLRNINLRIKLIYGQEFGIHIYSKKDEGTRVVIYLPAK